MDPSLPADEHNADPRRSTTSTATGTTRRCSSARPAILASCSSACSPTRASSRRRGRRYRRGEVEEVLGGTLDGSLSVTRGALEITIDARTRDRYLPYRMSQPAGATQTTYQVNLFEAMISPQIAPVRRRRAVLTGGAGSIAA